MHQSLKVTTFSGRNVYRTDTVERGCMEGIACLEPTLAALATALWVPLPSKVAVHLYHHLV